MFATTKLEKWRSGCAVKLQSHPPPWPSLEPIEPKTPRWEPTADPNDIVVPGLDTTAPVNDQIEQIEQLITIKLQNIDANFSKMQHIMASRILPAVKRYAVGTEPVRRGTKFWTTFYEQAAQIRIPGIPTYDEYSSMQDMEDKVSHTDSDAETAEEPADGERETTATPRSNRTFNSDGTSSEVSFMPGQAAVSSTPATASRHRTLHAHDSFASQDSDPTPLTGDDQISVASSSAAHISAHYNESQDITQRPNQLQGGLEQLSLGHYDSGKGKARETSQPLLHNVLRRTVASSDDTAQTNTRNRAVSPLKLKPKTPVLKTMNPYLPPDTDPSNWKGLVNLADPSLATPRRGNPALSSKYSAAHPTSTARPRTPQYTDDDSFDSNFGMSPPVMTDFARLPKLGQTPGKEAAKRITQNLLDAERRGVPTGTRGRGAESSMSTVSTPPSLSRYAPPPHGTSTEASSSIADASLESLMERVGLNISGFSAKYGAVANTTTAHVPEPRPPTIASASVFRKPSISSSSSVPPLRRAASGAPAPPHDETLEGLHASEPHFNPVRLRDGDLILSEQEDDADSDSDSLEYEDQNNTANPSAAFLLASQRQSYDDDDSFGSSLSGDELAEGDSIAPVHPFARGLAAEGDEDAFDDSFDDPEYDQRGDGEEETLFGVPPAERLRVQARTQNLRMMGEDLLQDTIGIGMQMAQAGRVDETPTPWMGRRGT
ncbi:hypothetical protein A0H81_11262 [Grifola frondosa]|uniref:DASH complex subunit ASK1 n=1 Tax=Grifola frondosa TaxID=5627 RepID=A0A1C7LXK4_GRIFR|nr:hypothetical protein A0H81_11262 [Grifola frondosa]